MPRGGVEGVLRGVAHWKISSGKNLKVIFNLPLEFWKFSELVPPGVR
jgi:hypothetical protein